MLFDSGSRLLSRAEQKYGHLAIHNLLKWIGGFQLLVFGFELISGGQYGTMIDYHPDHILGGEVWRLFSYVFIPRTTNMFWILIAIMFLFFISDGLENAWGSFRINLYVFGTIALMSLAGFLPFLGTYIEVEGTTFFAYSTVLNYVFYSSSFLAFASLFPNQIINLFLVIPIKVKWLGLVNAAMLLLLMLGDPKSGTLVFAGLLPFFCVFGPPFIRNLRQNTENAARRRAFEEKVKDGKGDSFHTCASCGKTDSSDPELEFRVAGDDEEYCVDCLPSRKNGETDA